MCICTALSSCTSLTLNSIWHALAPLGHPFLHTISVSLVTEFHFWCVKIGEMFIQSNLAIRNFLVALKLFLNAKSSLSLSSKWQIGQMEWFLNTNLFLIKLFLIAKFDRIIILAENFSNHVLIYFSDNDSQIQTFSFWALYQCLSQRKGYLIQWSDNLSHRRGIFEKIPKSWPIRHFQIWRYLRYLLEWNEKCSNNQLSPFISWPLPKSGNRVFAKLSNL